VVSDAFTSHVIASVGASAALIGLLFVAVVVLAGQASRSPAAMTEVCRSRKSA
jgi:hypothetical protein